jgi:hypothetical protein
LLHGVAVIAFFLKRLAAPTLAPSGPHRVRGGS